LIDYSKIKNNKVIVEPKNINVDKTEQRKKNNKQMTKMYSFNNRAESLSNMRNKKTSKDDY